MKKFFKITAGIMLGQEILCKSMTVCFLAFFSTIIFLILIPLMSIYKFAVSFHNTVDDLQRTLTEQLTELAIKNDEVKSE